MQERFLFEYAIVRYVPRVDREEFLNVGVILLCSPAKFLDALILINQDRIMGFDKVTDLELLKNHLAAFENIAKAGKGSGAIGLYDVASRFRWLTATRSTIIQCSKVHPGLCINPKETLQKLFKELVL